MPDRSRDADAPRGQHRHDRAKTRFFTKVSRGSRTPLTVVLGPLEDALHDGADVLAPQQRERGSLRPQHRFWTDEPGRVFVDRIGRSELTTTILDEGQVCDLVEKMLKTTGRYMDMSSPLAQPSQHAHVLHCWCGRLWSDTGCQGSTRERCHGTRRGMVVTALVSCASRSLEHPGSRPRPRGMAWTTRAALPVTLSSATAT